MTYAIELKALRKSFGKTEIIRGANLAVAPGERVAIIGPNGAGKSTLFNLISGRFAPTSGEIRLHGERIDGLLPYEINRKGLSRSFQITNIFHNLSVFENVRCAVLWSLGYKYSFWHRLNGLKDAQGPLLHFMGIGLNAKSAASWLGALAVAAVGTALFEATRRRFARRWGDVQGEIEAAIHAREAAGA